MRTATLIEGSGVEFKGSVIGIGDVSNGGRSNGSAKLRGDSTFLLQNETDFVRIHLSKRFRPDLGHFCVRVWKLPLDQLEYCCAPFIRRTFSPGTARRPFFDFSGTNFRLQKCSSAADE